MSVIDKAFWRAAYDWMDANVGQFFAREGQFGVVLIDAWASDCRYCTAIRGLLIGFAVGAIGWLKLFSAALLMIVWLTVMIDRKGAPDAQDD